MHSTSAHTRRDPAHSHTTFVASGKGQGTNQIRSIGIDCRARPLGTIRAAGCARAYLYAPPSGVWPVLMWPARLVATLRMHMRLGTGGHSEYCGSANVRRASAWGVCRGLVRRQGGDDGGAVA